MRMDKKELDKAVEKVRKKGYLEISARLRPSVAFDRIIFMEEFSGALALAVKILRAYQEKYGRKDEKKKRDSRGV